MIDEYDEIRPFSGGGTIRRFGLIIAGVCIVALFLGAYIVYSQFRIDVPARHLAVLTKKTGEDLNNDQEVAPDEDHKGLQLEVLSEGRYFYNPYFWKWEVYPMIEIPRDKMGVRIRLYGKDLPYGQQFPAGRKSI